MNTFPDYLQQRTNSKRIDAVTRTRTSNLQLTAWQLTDTVKLEIPVVIPYVLQADVDAILAFEAANRASAFIFHWHQDDADHTVQFMGPVQVAPFPGGYFNVTFTVGEV